MEQPNATPALRRVEIRTIFNRHRGARLRLAEKLKVTHSAISLWINGKSKSKRIAAAAADMAAELIASEGKGAAA